MIAVSLLSPHRRPPAVAVSTRGSLRVSRIVHPSPQDSEAEVRPTGHPAASFEEFATFSPNSEVAFPVAGGKDLIAKWIVLNCPAGLPVRTGMERCFGKLPKLFQSYRALNLFTRSFFLPPGESMFGVLTNPQLLPETPPHQVMEKFVSGLLAFPGCDFFYLEPVIVRKDNGRFIALSREECGRQLLLEEQQIAHLVRKNARWWKTQQQLISVARRLESFGLQAVDLAVTGVCLTAEILWRPVAWALRLPTLFERLRLMQLAEQAETLPDPMLRQLSDQATRLQMPAVAAKFRSRVRRWDPLLTFLKDGVHRLVGHWYEVTDGTKKCIRWHI